MAYTSAEARQELLEALEAAIDQIGVALAPLGAAYEQLDERAADRLDEELFGPVQLAYGRAKSTHARFADRHGLPAEVGDVELRAGISNVRELLADVGRRSREHERTRGR